MEGLKAIPYVALIFAVSGIILGASALVLGEFADTQTDADVLAALNNATEGVNNVAEQQPTLAIIAVMTVIIGVVAGVFVYLQYFR